VQIKKTKSGNYGVLGLNHISSFGLLGSMNLLTKDWEKGCHLRVLREINKLYGNVKVLQLFTMGANAKGIKAHI